MKVKRFFQLLTLIFSFQFTSLAFAQPLTEPLPPQVPGKYEIAVINEAEVFYRYSQKLPSVVNYFTQFNEQEIVDFYQDKYGQPNNTETKRGRLILHFSLTDFNARVIISTQNKKRQVDVMLR